MREIATLDYEQLGLTPERFDLGETPSPPQPAPRRGFVRRQLGARATRGQKTFDALVGVALPLVCLYFDPIVFRSAGFGFGAPLLGGYRIFAYAVIGLEIALLALWLALGERVGEWGGMLGGALVAGALFSLVVGVVLLPYSVVGLMLLIGALGFSPFLAAFVYWRNGRRALRASAARLGGTRRTLALAFGAALALGAPAYAHLRVAHAVGHAVEQLTSGDEAQALAATRRLKAFGWIAPGEFDSLVWAYAREPGAAKKERLARAYRELTGGDVETRLRVLND
ncbi:MAG: hypothetical protein LC785_18100 [Acidobacteria bacterium]|nr:hypothetical protein [Acidobacteriota bacterium]MCA1643799.1 hypothetical protein [Acidobacteriota bacterium]